MWRGDSGARTRRLLGLILLTAGLWSSLALLSSPGTYDVTDPRRGFLVWMDHAVSMGPIEGYQFRPYDYPPGAKALLGVAGSAGDWLGLERSDSLKLLLLGFQTLTGLVVLLLTRDLVLAGAIWLGTTINAIGHGYLDILYAPFLMVSLVALQRNQRLRAWAFWCLACTIKAQPLILLPFYLVHIGGIGQLRDVGRIVRDPRTWGAASWTAAAAIVIIVMFGQTETREWAVTQAVQKATAHREVSGNAMNAGWIGSYLYQVVENRELGPAEIRETEWRVALKGFAIAVLGWVLWLQIRLPKTPHHVLLSILGGCLAYFTFNAGVHENHLFIPMLVALLWAATPDPERAGWHRSRLVLALGVAAFSNLNHLLFFDLRGQIRPPVLIGGPGGLDASVPLAFVSLLLFAATVRCLLLSLRSTRAPLEHALG
jgi:hypothetical protein